MSISPPDKPTDHPDRFLQCQEAIEDAFQDLVEQAVAAGWGEAETVAAVVELADHHMLAQGEISILVDFLEQLRRRGQS